MNQSPPPTPKPSLTLVDALPDLTVGLVGIPIAMSLQQIAGEILPTSSEQLAKVHPALLTAHRWDGFFYFFFLLVMYGMVSSGLLMLFEVDKETAHNDDAAWQNKLLKRLILLTIPVLGVIAGLVFLGQSYVAEIGPGGAAQVVGPKRMVAIILGFTSWIAIPLLFNRQALEKYQVTFFTYALLLGTILVTGLAWFYQ